MKELFPQIIELYFAIGIFAIICAVAVLEIINRKYP